MMLGDHFFRCIKTMRCVENRGRCDLDIWVYTRPTSCVKELKERTSTIQSWILISFVDKRGVTQHDLSFPRFRKIAHFVIAPHPPRSMFWQAGEWFCLSFFAGKMKKTIPPGKNILR